MDDELTRDYSELTVTEPGLDNDLISIKSDDVEQDTEQALDQAIDSIMEETLSKHVETEVKSESAFFAENDLEVFEEDDDEDDDSDSPSAFSMREILLQKPYVPLRGNVGWEVIRYRKESIFECSPIVKNQVYQSNGSQGLKVKMTMGNRLKFKDCEGLRVSNDETNSKFVSVNQKFIFGAGGWAKAPSKPFTLEQNGMLFHFRPRSSKADPIPKKKKEINSNNIYAAGYLTWVHFAIIALLSVLNPTTTESMVQPKEDQTDRFAKIALQEFKKPKPKPTPRVAQPEVRRKPTIKKQRKRQKTVKRKAKRRLRVARKPVRNAPPPPDLTQVGALGKLGGKGLFSKTAKTSNQLVAAVSNVHAIRSAGGIQTFKMSGNMAALPGRQVRMARVSGVKAVGGTPQGDGFGRASVGVKRKEKVKGLIVDISPPPTDVAIRGGLTREEIARVVQQHVSEIRYCYEKGLLNDPSLSGKIVAKWDINSRGRVSTSGIRSSTVREAGVHRCLVGEIKSWKFPKPRDGGVVAVTFPFVFDAARF